MDKRTNDKLKVYLRLSTVSLWDIMCYCGCHKWYIALTGTIQHGVGQTSLYLCVKLNYQLPNQPRSQGPLSTSGKYPGYGWSRVYTCQPKPHRGWVVDLICHCCLGCWMLRCYTDVILKLKEVVCKRSCLNSASSQPELLWVWDVDWGGTLLIFHCFF